MQIELSPFFQRVLVSDEIGLTKPDPRAFEAALLDQDSASHILFVDDQISNVKVATSLGMHAIHANGDPNLITRISQCLQRI